MSLDDPATVVPFGSQTTDGYIAGRADVVVVTEVIIVVGVITEAIVVVVVSVTVVCDVVV